MKKTIITCDCCDKELDVNTCLHVEVKATIPAKQYDNVTGLGLIGYSYSRPQSVFIPEHDEVILLDYCESCYNIWKENYEKIVKNHGINE